MMKGNTGGGGGGGGDDDDDDGDNDDDDGARALPSALQRARQEETSAPIWQL